MPQGSKVELYAAIRCDHHHGIIIETGTDSYQLASTGVRDGGSAKAG
ncbi:hypothetical protein AB0M29_34800 [Streptomyces sp. NPDC051976]